MALRQKLFGGDNETRDVVVVLAAALRCGRPASACSSRRR